MAIDLKDVVDRVRNELDEFTLGGFFSLSGYSFRELRGQNFGVARLGYLYHRKKGSQFGAWPFGRAWVP